MADPNWNVTTRNITPISNKLYVYYRCSKCNHSNVHEHKIDAANDKLVTKRNNILAEAKEHKYSTAVFRCKCEKCGHMENWSKYNPPALEKCISVNVLLAFLALVGTIFGFVPWPLILTFFGIAVHAGIISAIIDSARTKQARAMNPKYLPIIATDMDSLKAQVAAAFPDSSAHNPQPAKQQNDAHARPVEQPHTVPKQPTAAAPKFTPAAPKQPKPAAPKFTPAAPKQPEPAVKKYAAPAPQQPGFTPSAGISIADEILKFKGLLDAGIITREEFEAKKKQLLKM